MTPPEKRLAPFLAALLCGCGVDAQGDPGIVTDSAGIRIVESDVSRIPVLSELELITSLGTVASGGPQQFHEIRDVELLDSARIAVADGGSEEVRIFGLEGDFLTSFGGRGNGPREFRALNLVQDVADSIFSYDAGNERISVRSRDGALVRSFHLEWFSGLLFPVEFGQDGRALTITASHMVELEGTGRLVDESLVSIYAPDGSLVDSLRRVPQNERFVRQVGDFRTTVGAPFSAPAGVVRFGPGFCHTFGPAPQVRCYGTGGALEEIWRLALPPRAVTAADVDRFWSAILDEEDGPYRQAMLRLRTDLTFPERMPAFSALLVEDDSLVWARRYEPEPGGGATWWLFDRGGRAIARLETPSGFEVRDVEHGLVAGVWRDELEVEHVRVYRR